MTRPIEPTRPNDLREFRDDLKATLAARRELSPEMEDALVASFLQQMERAIEAMVDQRIAHTMADRGASQRGRTGTVVASLALSIPLVGIAGMYAGLTGIVLVLVMIVIVNRVDFRKP